MGAWLRSLFTPPVFADGDQTRAARLLHVTLSVLIVLAGRLHELVGQYRL